MQNEFTLKSPVEITLAIFGKTVRCVSAYDEHGEEFLDFEFSDGKHLKIRYDYIYDWEVK